MSKTLILHSSDGPVARHLRHLGYRVMDPYQAHGHKKSVDAILYAGYRPDSVLFNTVDCADMSLGSCHADTDNRPITLNITGQSPQQVQSLLESRLRRHEG